VSGDLQHAKVRISVMGDATQQHETMEGLERARGFLRRRVAQELRHMRMVPELHLVLDTSLDYSLHIDDVLRQVAHEREQNPPKLDAERKEEG
jgi:ribosome-binding factor A